MARLADTALNWTHLPGVSSAGSGRSMSHNVGVGAPDQLPAAGRFAWVDAAELAGQADGAGGHPGAGFVAARHVQPGIATDEVGESRRETAESDPPQGAGVGRDHPDGVQPGQPSHLDEVGAVVHHVDHDVGAAVDRASLDDVLRREP